MKILEKNRLWMMLCAVILFGLGLMLLPAIASAAEVQFSIPEGHYDEPQTVVLTCDPGWKVCYTLDGTSPIIQPKIARAKAKQNYPKPNFIGDDNPVIISVDHFAKIRAVAYRENGHIENGIVYKYEFSSVKNQTYTIGSDILVGDNLLFSLAGGIYTEEKELTITSLTGWNICYTTDGSDPVHFMQPSGNGFSNPVKIPISESCTIKAVAYSGYISSTTHYTFSWIAEQNYRIIDQNSVQIGEINFMPAGGTFDDAVEVTLTGPAGWSICYTTDGSSPVNSVNNPIGTHYNGPITISESTVLKVVAYQFDNKKQNYTFSEIVEQTYQIISAGSVQIGDINFMPAGGSFEDAVEVTLTGPAGWNICYTTDGSDPVDTSFPDPIRGIKYTGPITISESTVIKAVAYQNNGLQYTIGEISEQTYQIIPAGSVQIGDINFMPAGGDFEDAVEVTLTAPAGWNICYTTDGSDPVDTSFVDPIRGIQYTGPITISESTVIKAIAYQKTGFIQYTFSEISEQTYQIIPAGSVQIGDINFMPSGGLIENPVEVTLTAPDDYSICYTTDGSDPVDHSTNTPAGTQYIGPIMITEDTVLKAATYQKNGYQYSFSPVAGQIYFFPDYTLTLTVPEFTPVFKGYAQPEAQSLIIESIGNSDVTITSVSLSGPAADSFILNKTDGAVIQAEETDNTTYTIQPKAGLDRGFYSAKVTVAYDGGATAEADVTFTVNGMDAVSAPVISPAAGNYQSLQWITLTSATEGAYIYYTTDGTDPNSVGNGELYTGPIPVTADMTIKAIAVKAGMERSVITEAAYTIRLQVFYGENDLYLAQEHQQVICPFIPEKDGFYRFYCGDEEISTNIRVYDENGELVGAQLGEMRNNNWIAELEGGREYTVKVESLYGTGTVTVLVHSTMLYNIYADPDTTHGQIGISSGALAPENGSGGNIIGRTYAGAEVFFTGEPDNGYGLRSIEIVNAIGGVLPQDPVFTMPFGTVTVRAHFDTLQTLSFEGDEHARFTNIWQDGGGMPVWEDVFDREVICGQLVQMNWECDEDWTADTITVTTDGGDPVDWTFGWDSGDRKVIQFEMPGENVHVAMTSTTFSFDSADFILPADTQSIEANAFQGDTHITAVVIPANCGSIGQEAFKDCVNLSYIRIPQGCEIGTNAFDGCEWVRIYGTEGSSAWQYCETHDNCIFVEE